MDTYSRALAGRKSRANGQYFEGMIEAACKFYEDRGIAAIDKTPEAMRVIKPMDRSSGHFLCCFDKKSQPDFKGALMDSTMVLFDAKHTDTDRIRRDAVSDEQEKCFERYGKMGALCFVVASLEFRKFYRIPWVVFRDMKIIYGRKYMDSNELKPYEIKSGNGILKFLDGIELKERKNDEDTE